MKKKKLRKIFLQVISCSIFLFFYLLSQTITQSEVPKADSPPLLFASQIQNDLHQIYKSAIHNANSSILLCVYTLTDKEIIHSLKKKSEEGIKVEVVTDAKTSQNLAKKLGSKVTLLQRSGEGIMHLKILVVDRKLVWMGSANMTKESLKLHGNLVTAFESANLAKAISLKAASFTPNVPEVCCESIGNQPIELWFLPDSQAISYLKELISSAKKTVKVAMFTWTRLDLAQEIVRAAKRGVHAEVVVDHYSGNGVSAKVVSYLKKEGIHVRLSQGTALLHHKFLYIDSNVLVNGSANWTRAAFTKNDDCFLILKNLSHPQKKQMDKLWDTIRADSALAVMN